MVDSQGQVDRCASTYQQIKHDLIAFVYRPGERLHVADLAERLLVSPTPIREALSRLAEERLVVNVPYKGYFCRSIDHKEIEDIYEMILALMRQAVVRIFKTCSDVGRRQIAEAIVGYIDESRINGAPAEAIDGRTIEKIYERLFSVCANNAMSLSMRNLIDRSSFYRSVFLNNVDEARLMTALFSHLARTIECSDLEDCVATVQEIYTRKIAKSKIVTKESLMAVYVNGRYGEL